MKRTIIILAFILLIFNVSAQTEKENIETIRTHFKWVNSQKDFDVYDLNNLDFLEHATDNGGTLQGFYKDSILYKIVESIGLSNGIITSEYYLWDNELFFVYYTEKSFKEVYDENNNFVELDYTKTETKYEERHYFDNDKEIKHLEKGENITGNKPDNFVSVCNRYKNLLDNKKQYNSDYKKLQGTWSSTDDKSYTVEFDGLIRIDYYDGESVDNYRINIIDGGLICTDLNNGERYIYGILSLTDKNLTLQYIARGNLLVFIKK